MLSQVVYSLLLYLHTHYAALRYILVGLDWICDDLLSTSDESQRHSITLKSFQSIPAHKVEVVARKSSAFGTTLGFWFSLEIRNNNIKHKLRRNQPNTTTTLRQQKRR